MSATAVASATTSAKKDSVPEIIAASMVGTAIEFYDNYCYSIASASYFGAIFFPAATKANPAIGTMLAFLTFAVSFLARPFGSMLFGHFGDKIGRKTTLVVALMTMGISTFLVGCLPSYDQLGILAIIILCVCRACQGVGLAGEWSGAALVATENAPAHKRALYGSFPNLGARSASSAPTASTCCSTPRSARTRCRRGAGASRSCAPPCSSLSACMCACA